MVGFCKHVLILQKNDPNFLTWKVAQYLKSLLHDLTKQPDHGRKVKSDQSKKDLTNRNDIKQ